MSAIQGLLSAPLTDRIGWALVHFLWQGAVLAIVLGTLLWLLRHRSANLRYLASCGALILMALCVPVTLSVVPASEPAAVVEPAAEPGTHIMPEAAAPAPRAAEPIEMAPLAPAVGPASRPLPAAEPTMTPWWEALREAVEAHLGWLVAGWVLGVLALSVRLLVGWRRVRRMSCSGSPRGCAGCGEVVAELARRMRIDRSVRVLRSALAGAPVVVGWLKPVVLLPAGALTGLTPEQLEAVLAHELAHVRRHDYAVNLAQTAIETVLFYHPAVHWVSARTRAEREVCCDEMAVEACGDSLTYARALTELEGLCCARRRVAVGLGGGSLMERIRRIVGLEPERESVASRWLAGLVVVLVAACAGAYVAAAPRPPTEGHPQTKASTSGEGTKEEPQGEPKPGEEPTTYGAEYYQAELPDGASIELGGLSYHPSENAQWWRPDGSPMPERAAEQLEMTSLLRRLQDKPSVTDAEWQSYRVAFLHRLPDIAGYSLRADFSFRPEGRFIKRLDSSLGRAGPGEPSRLRMIQLHAFRRSLKEATAVLDVISGKDDVLAVSRGSEPTGGQSPSGGPGFSRAEELADGVAITAFHQVESDDWVRAIAIDKSGRRHSPTSTESETLAGSGTALRCTYSGLSLEDIREFRLIRIPGRTIEFRNVSLKPEHETEVEITVEPEGEESSEQRAQVNRRLAFRLASEQPVPDTCQVPYPGDSEKTLHPHRKVVLDERHVTSARAVRSKRLDGWSIEVGLTPEGSAKLEAATAVNVGKRLGIFVDGECVSAPVIRTAIGGEKAIIAGAFSRQEAEQMAESIRPDIGEAEPPAEPLTSGAAGQYDIRIYQVRDLLSPREGQAQGEAPERPPQRAEELIAMLKQVCGEGTWGQRRDDAAGWAEVLKADPGAILVRQTPEVHKCIEELLEGLTAARSVQVELRWTAELLLPEAGPAHTGSFVEWAEKALGLPEGELQGAGPYAAVGSGEGVRDVKVSEYAVKSGVVGCPNGETTALRDMESLAVRPVVSADMRYAFLEVGASGTAPVQVPAEDGGVLVVALGGPRARQLAAEWPEGTEAPIERSLVLLILRPRLLVLKEQEAPRAEL